MRKVNLLNPWTVTGLTDGDGSFYVTISKVLKKNRLVCFY